MKKKLVLFVVLFTSMTTLASCKPKKQVDGAYDFIIYESDSDNNDLSDNPVVAKYHIEYYNCKTVTDTLINKDGKYYFDEKSEDYLVLVDSVYGLSYKDGYFKNYSGCSNGQIDVSWSYTAVNGTMAGAGIGETSLEGLNEYGFVINGWAQ